MLPDSMRIHVRKCNVRTPQKPTKRRLRERKLNPPKKTKTSKRNIYHSTKPGHLNGRKKKQNQDKNDNMPKYKSQRHHANHAKNGYGAQYGKKMQSSQRETSDYSSNQRGTRKDPGRHGRKQSSNRQVKPTQKRGGNKHRRNKKIPEYDEFKDINYNNPSSSSNRNNIQSGRGMGRGNNERGGFPGAKVDFIKQMEMQGPPPPTSMSKCRICGRTFASNRIAKHQKACAKASKKPKKIKRFHKKITKKEKNQLKKNKPVPKWKQQHKEFIKQMKYMKKLKEVEDAGGDIRLLAPPPVYENPGLIPCKFCSRKFREAAHERHENICQKVFGGKKVTAKKGSTRKVKKAKPAKGRRRY